MKRDFVVKALHYSENVGSQITIQEVYTGSQARFFAVTVLICDVLDVTWLIGRTAPGDERLGLTLVGSFCIAAEHGE